MFWLTDARLVAAVSEAGGLGVLGPHAGQNSLPKDDNERAERMREEIKKVKKLTSNLVLIFSILVKIQIFNFNLC